MKKIQKGEEQIVNAEGKTLGRLASEIATFLAGKSRVSYQRHIYSGSDVKVVNVSKIKITTKKLEEIHHTKYSGHRGGLRVWQGIETFEKKGLKELVRLAVYHMLPGNKLRREMMKNLKIEN